MPLFVGVDVGGTTTTVAIGDAHRKVLKVSDQFDTRSSEGPDATINQIVQRIEETIESLNLQVGDVRAISLATPGPATRDGVLLRSPNLDPEQWDRCPVRQRLETRFARCQPGVSVSYVGDGQAAAVGEYATRSGRIQWDETIDSAAEVVTADADAASAVALRSLFMIAVGTGFGGGEVRDGKVVRGCKGRAGHAGHLMLPSDAFRYEHDRQLKVGNAYSTVESAVSLTALTHQLGYRLGLDQWRDHVLNHQQGSVKAKAKQLRELAAEQDPLALQLMDDQAKALGISLLMINYIGDYDLLVIGGGVCDMTAEIRQRYLEITRRSYFDHALDGFRGDIALDYSVCGDQASVIGALFYAYRGFDR